MHCNPEATEFSEIMQNKGHYAVQGHRFSYQSKARIRLPISDYRQHCAQRKPAGISFTQRTILRFFAPQGRHVAPMGVKFGIVGLLPNFQRPVAAKFMHQTPKSFRGARTCSRSSITMPSLVGLGFHPPP